MILQKQIQSPASLTESFAKSPFHGIIVDGIIVEVHDFIAEVAHTFQSRDYYLTLVEVMVFHIALGHIHLLGDCRTNCP